ncbi:DUF58 domain-containing protein [Litorihabitans aurantiacus]|uniref:DUF58 domain-containing protein n=1 Tax=Litorihabitans aurantiacus TaxID=1930061 RepID=A0AA37UPL9_9MICO|nr:DUF58 domain-containing protein [Litorihabitans aurantiacus]GMA30761.1 hypothetical protein GCM10025875_07530 [Litorihabitans aurantiacus]
MPPLDPTGAADGTATGAGSDTGADTHADTHAWGPPRLTARGTAVLALALALLAGGLLARFPSVVALGTGLVVLLAISLAGVLARVPVDVERRTSLTRVTRLADCTAEITVTNLSSWASLRLEGLDRVGDELRPVALPRLAPGERGTGREVIPTDRRGRVVFGPLLLRRSGVAGLVVRTSRHGEATSVLVEPRVLDALSLAPGLRRGHTGAQERIEHGGTDLVGLREYIAGDDLRRLHWATSARRGQLMVRQDADPALPFLTVLLDDRLASYASPADLEEAVDVAASLLATASERESPGRLVTAVGGLDLDNPVSRVGDGGAELARDVREALALLRGVGNGDSDADDAAGGPADLPLTTGAPDVLVVVTGAQADLGVLLLEAAAAPTAVIAVVDPDPRALVSAVQGVTVLRGPRADDLVHGWRTAVAR